MDKLLFYKLLHLFALIVLTAQTFMAFANPDPVNRKRTLMITGIAALLMLVTGFGMLAIQKIPFASGWVIVKLVCWAGVAAMSGVVYRRAHLRGLLSFVTLTLILVAMVMVLFRPF
ncbi:MAG TPA: hypothetical protein VG936_09900 [Lacunisphaera sp.]|nr:hypothetical protein [Lacunisphaera sp.]